MLNILCQTPRIIIAQSTAFFDDYRPPYGFNLGLHVADNPSAVLKNRAIFLNALQKISPNIHTLHWLNQVHSDQVCAINTLSLAPMVGDALIGDKIGVGLCIMTADCVPIALFNEQKIANIHAGWSGLANGIIKKTCALFAKDSQKYAYIGACISGGCYEIPKDLAMRILHDCQRMWDIPRAIIEETMIQKDDGKVLFAVGELARRQLESLGVVVINQTSECSYQGNYFSYRRATHHNQTHTGRMAMVVAKIA